MVVRSRLLAADGWPSDSRVGPACSGRCASGLEASGASSSNAPELPLSKLASLFPAMSLYVGMSKMGTRSREREVFAAMAEAELESRLVFHGGRSSLTAGLVHKDEGGFVDRAEGGGRGGLVSRDEGSSMELRAAATAATFSPRCSSCLHILSAFTLASNDVPTTLG